MPQLLSNEGVLQQLTQSHSSIISHEEESSSSSSSFSSSFLTNSLAQPSDSDFTKASPATTRAQGGEGRQLLSPGRHPTLRRPFTPITRPRSQVVQTPVSDDYIKSFPEIAAPEGLPGEDPEEDTIREAIFELQRVN